MARRGRRDLASSAAAMDGVSLRGSVPSADAAGNAGPHGRGCARAREPWRPTALHAVRGSGGAYRVQRPPAVRGPATWGGALRAGLVGLAGSLGGSLAVPHHRARPRSSRGGNARRARRCAVHRPALRATYGATSITSPPASSTSRPSRATSADTKSGREPARLGRAGRVGERVVGPVDVVREVDLRHAGRSHVRDDRVERGGGIARTSSAQNWRTPSVDSQCSRSRPDARVPTCTSRPPRPRSSFAWNDQVAKQ